MPELTGLRVLLVEDDGVVAMMMAEYLREMGFGEVRTAYTLSRALVDVRDWVPHVALLDVRLTDGMSLPVAKVLADRLVPSVFMSADPRAAEELGLERGSVLIKPFSPATLQAALQRALRQTT